MTKFTEKKLEQTFIELLKNESFPHFSGKVIPRNDSKVLIEEDLKKIFTVTISK